LRCLVHAVAISSLPADRPHARTHWDDSLRPLPRRSWLAALLAWAAPRVIPGVLVRSRIHPDSRGRIDVRFRIILRLGVPVRDRPGHSEAIGGDGHYGRTSRHRPDCRFPAGGARFRHTTDRRGRAPLLRFVPLQHMPAAARRVRWMPTIRTIPLRRFRRRPARLSQYRLSATSARAVLRWRRHALVSVVVADVRVVLLRQSSFRPMNEAAWPLRRCRRRHVCGSRCGR